MKFKVNANLLFLFPAEQMYLKRGMTWQWQIYGGMHLPNFSVLLCYYDTLLGRPISH